MDNKNNIADNTGAETNKKIPNLKRKLPVLKFDIVNPVHALLKI